MKIKIEYKNAGSKKSEILENVKSIKDSTGNGTYEIHFRDKNKLYYFYPEHWNPKITVL